jgi:hypothetical protein
MVIYTTRHIFLASFLGAILTVIVSGLSENKQKQEQTTAVVSKCDSIHLANDSLVQRMEVIDRRLRQYQIGLWFLRDKNKQAYDYVINAGNLDFKNEW